MIDKNLPPSEYASNITPRPIPLTTLVPGAQTPRESAFLSQKNLDLKQTMLGKIAKGGKRKIKVKRGGGDTVIIPSLDVDYPNAGDIHNTHQKVVQSLMQTQANSQFDKNARLKGGGCGCNKWFGGKKKTYKRGGKNYWGCFSGGKSRGKFHKRKTRKTRKTRKGRK